MLQPGFRTTFKQLPETLSGLIERSVYNRRRRALHLHVENLRQQVVAYLDKEKSQPLFLIDTMPVEVCKLARVYRSRISQESPDTAPDTGYCAAQ